MPQTRDTFPANPATDPEPFIEQQLSAVLAHQQDLEKLWSDHCDDMERLRERGSLIAANLENAKRLSRILHETRGTLLSALLRAEVKPCVSM